MGANGGQRRHQHSNVVREADTGQKIGNGVEGQDEIGERRHQRHAHAGRRLLVERAVIGCNHLVHERHHATGAARGLPESVLHPVAALLEFALAARFEDFTDSDVIHSRSTPVVPIALTRAMTG